MAGRKPILVTPEMQQEAERLSGLGLNERQIAEALGMAYSSFQKHKSHFRSALKKGRASLRERITESLLSKVDMGDTASVIFACKRLGLLQMDIESPAVVKDARTATMALSKLFTALASGQITESQADKLAALLEKFMKAFELTEIEERLAELEEHMKKRGNYARS